MKPNIKLITVNGQDFTIEKYSKNWYARVGGLLTIKPTIKEIKADILEELKEDASFIWNNNQSPKAKGTYTVIYTDEEFGTEYFNGKFWEVKHECPVAYWKRREDEGYEFEKERRD